MGNAWVLVSRNVWPPHTPPCTATIDGGSEGSSKFGISSPASQVHLGRSATLGPSQARTATFNRRGAAYLDTPVGSFNQTHVELRSPGGGGSAVLSSDHGSRHERNMPRMGRDTSLRKFHELESRAERKEEVKRAARMVSALPSPSPLPPHPTSLHYATTVTIRASPHPEG
jgi:hypothetical protein